ncbi:MAG: PQQ-binding-like beta-propeller repeat protein [Planctomycetota bacterium]
MRLWFNGFLVVGYLSVALSSMAHGQEWTRFRGPNGTGVAAASAKSIPVRWGETDAEWKARLPGAGHSSPVVWGDRVFLLSADPSDATQYVLCLNGTTGKTAWQRTYESTSHHLHPRNTFASSTPTVDQDRVYVAWSTPEQLTFKALDHEGNEVWTKDLGPWTSQHGFGTSPMLYGDFVILFNSQQAEQLDPGQEPGQSFMMAFDRETGRLRWKQPLNTTRVCYGTPCIHRPEDGPPQLICHNTGNGIFSLDANTGRPNWSVDVFEMRTVSSPIVVGDLVFGTNGSGGGGNYLVAVRAGDAPEEVYRITRQAPYVSTAVARNDLLFLFYDRGIASCVRASDGERIWQERLSRSFSGSPVLVQDRLYCIDDDGVVFVLAAEDQFEELARNPLGEPSRSTPAISGGRMFLRTVSHLTCIGSEEK